MRKYVKGDFYTIHLSDDVPSDFTKNLRLQEIQGETLYFEMHPEKHPGELEEIWKFRVGEHLPQETHPEEYL